jgi:hypothetical protein
MSNQMITSFLTTIAKSLRTLNPSDVRNLAEREVNIGLTAASEDGLNRMWDFLAPAQLSERKKDQLVRLVHPLGPRLPGMPPRPAHVDLELWEEGLPKPPHAFTFYRRDPARTVREIIDHREELGLPLARQFVVFRKPVSEKIVNAVSQENALFSIATSLPNIVPNLLSLPFAVGEFASDTAFITANQLRMAFLLAGANDRPIGYREQKTQVASVIAGAFGWRSLARQLISKLPFGAGVASKATVAYAGTWIVGQGLQKLYGMGGQLSRQERETLYDEGLAKGKTVVTALVARLRKTA